MPLLDSCSVMYTKCSEDVTPGSGEITFACPVAKYLLLYPSYDVYINVVYMTDEKPYVQIRSLNRNHWIFDV